MRAMGEYAEQAQAQASSSTRTVEEEQALVMFEDRRLATRLVDKAAALAIVKAANDARLMNNRREKAAAKALLQENEAKLLDMTSARQAVDRKSEAESKALVCNAETERVKVEAESKVLVCDAEVRLCKAEADLLLARRASGASRKRKAPEENAGVGTAVHISHGASKAACDFFHRLETATGKKVEHVCVSLDANQKAVYKGTEVAGLVPGRRVRADGVERDEHGAVDTVWEFLGNRFHGFPPDHPSFHTYLGINNIPAKTLYESTAANMDLFAESYIVHYVWEHKFKLCLAAQCPRSVQDVICTWTLRGPPVQGG
jgi:hypothetical protein